LWGDRTLLNLDPQHLIERDDKSESGFYQLKKALMTGFVLSLPVQNKYQLYVYEKRRLTLRVVIQLWSITPQPVGYLRKELSQVTKGSPGDL
jgi:hypothetical protein